MSTQRRFFIQVLPLILLAHGLASPGRAQTLPPVPSEHYPGGAPAQNAAAPRPPAVGSPQSLENDIVKPPAAKTGAAICGKALDPWQMFASMHSFVPTPLTPLKTVAINFNIVQKSDGTGNWTNSPADLNALRQLASWANDFYVMPSCSPTDPCPGATYPPDTRIRLSLENIYFYKSDALWQSTDVDALLAAAFQAHPGALRQLNIFFTGGSFGGASGFALTPTTNRNYDQAIVLLGATDSDGTGSKLAYAASGTITHELGHVFGLMHTYQESCCPETFDPKSYDFLNDVFCPPTNPYPQKGGWGCDPKLPPSVNSCTNNMMGGVRDGCLFSQLQIGRMHRSLSTSSAQKYVKTSACLSPPAGMGLWLPFNEASGTTAMNPSGSSGLLVGNPGRSAGKVDNALCFNGTSQYVDVPGYAEISFGTDSFSIEAWVKREAEDSGVRVIAEKRSSTGGALAGYSLFLYNGTPGLQLADGTFDNYGATKPVPADGNWHHVAVTVDRFRPSGSRFYLDGVAIGSFDARKHRKSLDSGAPFRVGATTLSSTASFFKGCIDEVAAYNRLLTPSEVQEMAAQNAGRCKRYCTASGATFPGGATSVSVGSRICNATALPQAYMYWYEARPGALCGWGFFTEPGGPVGGTNGVDGPTSFTPCSDLITVPPGTCVTVPTQMARPGGLKMGSNRIACYDLAVQSLGNDDVASFRCEGTLGAEGFPR